MCVKIEIELPFTTSTLSLYNQMICSVLSKNGTSISLFLHKAILDFFSFVTYLQPKDYIKRVKNLFSNFGLVHDVPLTRNKPVKLRLLQSFWNNVDHSRKVSKIGVKSLKTSP